MVDWAGITGLADDRSDDYDYEVHDPAGFCGQRFGDQTIAKGATRPTGFKHRCRYCGADGLKWRTDGVRWALYENVRGEHNQLKEHNCRVAAASPDEFDAL